MSNLSVSDRVSVVVSPGVMKGWVSEFVPPIPVPEMSISSPPTQAPFCQFAPA